MAAMDCCRRAGSGDSRESGETGSALLGTEDVGGKRGRAMNPPRHSRSVVQRSRQSGCRAHTWCWPRSHESDEWSPVHVDEPRQWPCRFSSNRTVLGRPPGPHGDVHMPPRSDSILTKTRKRVGTKDHHLFCQRHLMHLVTRSRGSLSPIAAHTKSLPASTAGRATLMTENPL